MRSEPPALMRHYEKNVVYTVDPIFDAMILDKLDYAVIVYDTAERIVRWNHAAEVLYGWTADDVMGRVASDVVPVVRYQGLISDDELVATIREHGYWQGELLQRRRDGQELSLEAWISEVRDAQGDVTHRVMVNNSRASHLDEDQFHLLFEYSPDAIWLIDPHDPDVIWPIVDCNDAACQMTGYTREELIGQSNNILNPGPGYFDIGDGHIDRLRESGVLRDEDVQRHKDGRLFYIEYTSRLITLGGRELILGIDRDITERKRVEAAIIEAKETAERANLAKSEFLSRMSHELRTPLNAILGFSQHLATEIQDPEYREYLDYIVKAGDHLLGLINDVLDIARVESTQIHIEIQPVRLDKLTEDALTLVQGLAETRGITVSCLLPEPCEMMVDADPRRLTQVLVNILTNAIKYNRAHGRIEVTCSVTDQHAQISVMDTGYGISATNIGRLFVPFERLGAERTTIEGVGLGLALSRQLIELMHGTITVESTPGTGTTFRIELPLSRHLL